MSSCWVSLSWISHFYGYAVCRHAEFSYSEYYYAACLGARLSLSKGQLSFFWKMDLLWNFNVFFLFSFFPGQGLNLGHSKLSRFPINNNVVCGPWNDLASKKWIKLVKNLRFWACSRCQCYKTFFPRCWCCWLLCHNKLECYLESLSNSCVPG